MASGRKTSLASLAGAKVEAVPGQYEPILVRLAPDKVVPTPLNPRTNFGPADSLVELGESMRKRQLQPVVVVSRASYLKLYPEHADHVGTASYVIANGERRYRGARQVDLPALEAIIREEVAASRQDFLDAVLSENIDRKNFDPIEEAHAVQVMVAECGSATEAATKFRRSKGWVSQRVALLRLAVEVQMMVRSGEIPVRDARELATHPQDEQMRLWRARTEERAQERAARAERKAEALPPAPDAAVPLLPDPPAAALRMVPETEPHPEPVHKTAAVGPAPQAAGPGPVAPVAAVPVQPAASGGGMQAPRPAVVPEAGPGADVRWKAAAEQLVAAFSVEERRKIVSYLMDVAQQEQETGVSTSA